MTKDNEQQKLSDSTDTAIDYSTCYTQPVTGFKLKQKNKSDLEYLQDWIDLRTKKDNETGTMIIEKIKEMLKENENLDKVGNSALNIADVMPRPFQHCKTDEQKYKALKGQVIWAVTHYGIVKTEGIIEHLRDTIKWLNEA